MSVAGPTVEKPDARPDPKCPVPRDGPWRTPAALPDLPDDTASGRVRRLADRLATEPSELIYLAGQCSNHPAPSFQTVLAPKAVIRAADSAVLPGTAGQFADVLVERLSGEFQSFDHRQVWENHIAEIGSGHS